MSTKAIEADVSIRSGIDGAVSIASGLVEANTQIGREVIKTVYEEPVLESLEVVANGTYEPEEGVDGYSDVTVSIPIYDGETEIEAESIDIIIPTNGKVMSDDIVIHGFDVRSMYAVSGYFTAREDGVLTIDTGYDGEGDPHIIVVWADGNVRSEAFLQNAPAYAVNIYSAIKRIASTPSYGTTNALVNQCYTNYAYTSDNDEYGIGYANTTLILSRSDPDYGAGKTIRFFDKKTMKIFAASERSESNPNAPYFATGIKYRYYVVYNSPQSAEPEPPQERIKASGSFIAQSTSTGYVLDTKNTDWTKLLIVAHKIPYPTARVRGLASRYINMEYGESGLCLSHFASSSGATFNGAGWNNVNVEDGFVFVKDGVVTFESGANQAAVGLFIANMQYDWYAWTDVTIPEPATETWSFTLDDDTVIEKVVILDD